MTALGARYTTLQDTLRTLSSGHREEKKNLQDGHKAQIALLEAKQVADSAAYTSQEAQQSSNFDKEVLVLKLKLKNSLAETKSAAATAEIKVVALQKEQERLIAVQVAASKSHKAKQVSAFLHVYYIS